MPLAVVSELPHVFKRLRHEPRFVLLVMLMLGLALGGITAMLAVVNGVLLKPLPYAQADRLVLVGHRHAERGDVYGMFSPQDHQDLVAASRSIESSTVYMPQANVNALVSATPVQLEVSFVAGNFFATLGAQPRLGRALIVDDDQPGIDVAVISDSAWRSLFGGDAGIVGSDVRIQGRPFRIVGVMPPAFDYPDARVQAWLPLSFLGESDVPRRREIRWLEVLARLRPGVTLDGATREIDATVAAIAQQHPGSNADWNRAAVTPLFDSIVGGARAPIIALFTATALVLLIACVNFANLLLVRAQRREREMATRGALGAAPGRLAAQLLLEAVVLTAAAAMVGAVLAHVFVGAFIAAAGTTLMRHGEIGIDAGVLALGAAVALAAALAASAYPAWRARRTDVAQVLASGGKSSTGRRHAIVRSSLVVVQVALVCALGYSTGLALDSLRRVAAIDTGVASEQVIEFTVRLDSAEYDAPGARNAARSRLLDVLRELPGVESAAASKQPAIGQTGENYSFALPDRPDVPLTPNWGVLFITEDYFRTLGIPLLQGRDLAADEAPYAPLSIIVNSAFAETYFPDRDAVGQRIAFVGTTAEIVGQVANARHAGPRDAVKPVIYASSNVFARSAVAVSVRTAGRSPHFMDSLRQAVWSVDPALPIVGMRWLDESVAALEAQPRLVARALSAFAFIAAAIGALGIFGLLAYIVGERRRELAIRLAIGARPQRMFAAIVGHGGRLALFGLLLGAPIAFAAARVLQTTLHDTAVIEPVVLITVAAGVILLALTAGLLPAATALRTQPMEVLRHD